MNYILKIGTAEFLVSDIKEANEIADKLERLKPVNVRYLNGQYRAILLEERSLNHAIKVESMGFIAPEIAEAMEEKEREVREEMERRIATENDVDSVAPGQVPIGKPSTE